MGNRLQHQPDRTVIPFVASVIVLMGGVAACLAILFVCGEGNQMTVAAVVGGGVAMGILLWFLRDRPEATQRSRYQWIFWRRRPQVKLVYRPQRVRGQSGPYGNNRPATAEELREMKEDINRWVPSRTRHGRQS